MEEDNLQPSNKVELYNVDTIEPAPFKEEADSIPKVEIPEKAKSEVGFDEMGNVIGPKDDFTYKAPKEKPKEIQIPTPGQRGKLGTFFLGPDIPIQGDFSIPIARTIERIGKAALGEKQEPPKEEYTYIETATAALIHAPLAMVHNGFSLVAELGDFVRGNGIPVEDRLITKLNNMFDNSFVGRVEKESKEIAYTDAVGMITDGISQIYGAGKIGQAIISDPVNKLRIAKIAEDAVAAAKTNKLIKPSVNLGRAAEKAEQLNKISGKDKFISIAIGGAGFGAGAALVASSEDIGTFGDFLKHKFDINNPFEIDRFEKSESGDEAARRLYNRFKFGGENFLVTFPFAYGAGIIQEIAKNGKEMAFSNSAFNRWIDKWVATPFRARGVESTTLFEGRKQAEGFVSGVKLVAKDMLLDIDQSLGVIAKESGISTGNPAFKRTIGRLEELLVAGEDSIQNGKIVFRGYNPKQLDTFKEFAKEIGINDKQVNSLVSELFNIREKFNVLKNNFLNSKNVQIGASELNKIFLDRMRNMFTSEYKIMTDRSIIPFLNYKPSDSDIQAVKNIINRNAKSHKKILTENDLDDILNDIVNNVTYNDVTKTPQFIIGENSALSDKATQIINIADNLKGGKFTPTEFVKTPGDLRSLQRLFGQKRDIRNTIVNVMEDLGTLVARDNFYNNMLKASEEAIKNGERAIVYPTYNDAVKNLRNRQIISGKNGLQIKSPLGEDAYVNPINGMFTSKEWADSLEFIDKIFLDSLAKQTWYQHLVLVPKGVFQIDKTILGPYSHTRNFISNTVFTGAQGNFFLNPAEMAKNFKQSFNIVQPQLIYRNTPKDQQLAKFLYEENVFGSSATAKDIHGLLDDMGKGGDFYSRLFTKFNDGLKRNFPMAGQATESLAKGIKRGYQIANDLYMAEDEFWKGYNFFAEHYKLKNATLEGLNRALKPAEELSIMKEAARIVRDTLPNYSFVPNFIKGWRRSPMGNFISWPAQIVSTSVGSVEQAYKEIMSGNPAIAKIGYTRLGSFAGMTAAAIPTINAIGRGLYGITLDQVAAIREFAPAFSKESSLYVYRDKDGSIKYIDASGTFVYDTVTNPAQAVLNGIQKEKVFNKNSPLMVGLYEGAVNGMARFMRPFADPSAYVSIALDLMARNGKTADGVQIWNPDASYKEKFEKGLGYVAKQYAPFSIPQFERLGKAITGSPGERGEKYEVSDEVAGFFGIRGQKIDVPRKMDYKINEFKSGIRNTRGLFTSETLKGGEIDRDAVILRFIEANAQRYKVMNKMGEVNQLAEILEMPKRDLRLLFDKRGEFNAYNHIERGRFYPFEVTHDIGQKFREQRLALESEFDNLQFEAPYDRETIQILNQLSKTMKQLPLYDDYYKYIRPEDWLTNSKRSEAPSGEQRVASAPLPPTPSPDAKVVQSSPQVSQDILPNGLTKTETVLLKPEEQLMRLNQRQAGPQQTGQV
jgi:hypothetical protein